MRFPRSCSKLNADAAAEPVPEDRAEETVLSCRAEETVLSCMADQKYAEAKPAQQAPKRQRTAAVTVAKATAPQPKWAAPPTSTAAEKKEEDGMEVMSPPVDGEWSTPMCPTCQRQRKESDDQVHVPHVFEAEWSTTMTVLAVGEPDMLLEGA